MPETLSRESIYGQAGLVHGDPFRLVHSFTPTEEGGIGVWDISEYAELARLRTLPVKPEGIVDKQQRYRVVTPAEWAPFSGHFPFDEERGLGPVTPGVFGLAIAVNRNAGVTDAGLLALSRDIDTVELVRCKDPLKPGDLITPTYTRADSNTEGAHNNFDVMKRGRVKPAIEISGLQNRPLEADQIAVYPGLEFAAHVAGLAILERLKGELPNNVSPAFLGLDDVKVLGRIKVGEVDTVHALATVIKARKMTSTASVEVTANVNGEERSLISIGSLLFGFRKL